MKPGFIKTVAGISVTSASYHLSAVQMMAAIRSGVDYLMTRNVQDYKAVSLPVIKPVELLALLK